MLIRWYCFICIVVRYMSLYNVRSRPKSWSTFKILILKLYQLKIKHTKCCIRRWNCIGVEWCITFHICCFPPKLDWTILHKPSTIRCQEQQENLRRSPYRHQPPWRQGVPQQICRYAKWIRLWPTKRKWQKDEHATRYQRIKWRVVERS